MRECSSSSSSASSSAPAGAIESPPPSRPSIGRLRPAAWGSWTMCASVMRRESQEAMEAGREWADSSRGASRARGEAADRWEGAEQVWEGWVLGLSRVQRAGLV